MCVCVCVCVSVSVCVCVCVCAYLGHHALIELDHIRAIPRVLERRDRFHLCRHTFRREKELADMFQRARGRVLGRV